MAREPVDEVGRHAYEGDEVMRRYGSRLPRVIHVSLGTNDDPGDVEASAGRSPT